MANTLKFKRGLLAGLPAAAEGEPLFTTDTADLYIGTSTGTQKFQKFIASGATTQILRGDGSLFTFPLTISSPTNGQVLKYNGTAWVNDSDAGITGSGSSGQVAYFNAATTLTASSNFIYNTNALQVSHPSGGVALILNNGATSGDVEALRVRDNTTAQQAYSLRIKAGTIRHLATWISGPGVDMAHEWSTATAAGAVNIHLTLTSGGNLLLGNTVGTSKLDVAKSANDTLSRANSAMAIGDFVFGAGLMLQQRLSAPYGFMVQATNNTAATYYPIHLNPIGGNVTIGSVSDTGQRLQVIGDTLLKGSGNTFATFGLTVQNSASTNLFRQRNDGTIILGTVDEVNLFASDLSTGNVATNGRAITFVSAGGLGVGYQFYFRNTFTNTSQIGGTNGAINVGIGFVPTSGSGTFAQIALTPTINQTGGANGITRGLYVQPTLTSAADWRSIETSNNTGWSYYGAGTANSYFNGSVGIASTTLTAISLRVSKNITGAVSSVGILQDGQIQTDVTSAAAGFRNLLNIAASTTIGDYYHIRLGESTIGAGVTLSQQIGLYINDFANGANRYGILSELSSGTNKWNLYCGGTAANYIAGRVGLGFTDPKTKIDVRGTSATADSTIQIVGNGVSTLLLGQNADGGVIRGQGGNNVLSFWTGGVGDTGASLSGTEAMRLTANRNLHIGAFTSDTGERLQVNGTMKVTGASTFGGNMLISKNSGSPTTLSLEDGTNTTSTESYLKLVAGTTQGYVLSWGQTKSSYRLLNAGDVALYKSGTAGDIAIFNDMSTGGIKMAAGASSTAHFTIASTGIATFASTVTSTQYRLSALNTAPATSSSTGTLGEIRIDADHIYVCTATNTWKRVAIATF